MGQTAPAIGALLRDWRSRRPLSQLALATEAGISSRHLSYLETGRARPSRDMVLHLAEHLDVPLRERNVLLTAAGFAPVFPQRSLDDPALGPVMAAVCTLLAAHEPFPALAVDRHWTILATNRAVAPLLDGVAPALLAPSANALRIGLHPDGLAPRIRNLAEWRDHVLARLARQVEATADPVLATLRDELASYPAPAPLSGAPNAPAVAVPLRLALGDAELSLISTTTVFGTPLDVTLAELALETFLPADPASAAMLRALCPPVGAGEGMHDRF
jgi:transcriptional regulator with XRE-family HTH domain